MIKNKDTAKKTAELLLQIKAIKLQPNKPFTWASGWNSPIYCDNRTVLSYPRIRTYLRENLAKIIELEYGKPDVIAGVATGAIAIGALVAQHLNVPFIYVRPEPKKHGRKNQIEGQLMSDKKVLVIEDLISTGKSSLNAVKALKEQNVTVLGMIGIFDYGFQLAVNNFKKENVQLHTLSDYHHLISEVEKANYIETDQIEVLKSWRVSPADWKPNQ